MCSLVLDSHCTQFLLPSPARSTAAIATADLANARRSRIRKQSLIYYQTAAGGFDDGAGGTGAFTFGPQYGFSGLAVFDYNNDGRLDYLGLSTEP